MRSLSPRFCGGGCSVRPGSPVLMLPLLGFSTSRLMPIRMPSSCGPCAPRDLATGTGRRLPGFRFRWGPPTRCGLPSSLMWCGGSSTPPGELLSQVAGLLFGPFRSPGLICSAPSGPTPPAGRCSGPPGMICPSLTLPVFFPSVRTTLFSGFSTPTPAPAPWWGTPLSSALRPSPSPGRTTTPPRSAFSPSSPITPAPSRPPPGIVRPTSLRGTSSPSPMPSSGFMTAVRSCPPTSTNPRPSTVPGWHLPTPPGRCSPAACICSASAHPNICKTSCKTLCKTLRETAETA